MKSNKVLLGLFVGFLTLVGGSVDAQNRFYEIGPSNVGGQMSSLVLDESDASHTTIIAGAYSGGIYVKSDDFARIENIYNVAGMDPMRGSNLAAWHFVPYTNDDNVQDILPVSAMVQGPGPDYTVFIGTGDDQFQIGSSYSRMSVLGKGIFRLDPNDFSIEEIPNTKPTGADSRFAAVHAMDYVYRNGKLYFYVASNTGLYRYTVQNDNWNVAPETIFSGNVEKLVVARQLKMAFFSVAGSIYKISDVTASSVNPVDITPAMGAFGHAGSHLKLACAPSDPSYLYVAVVDSTGMLDNVYLTRNQQNWRELATSTVLPFSTTSGAVCGDIVVDPGNPRHIYVGGSTIWSGTGYTDEGLYQWMRTSYSESELNSGDYMQSVYSSIMFVHSGIHQIIPAWRNQAMSYYMATDGGIYSTSNFTVYNNENNGLNTLQINGLAVSADGSVISGAVSNACPFVESRDAHNGGVATTTWYDDGSLGNINHSANILWTGTGGKVAASNFQQLHPQSRRNIFVSSENGRFGRSYADYMDYTQTQTWTINKAFVSQELLGGGPSIGQMYFWETDHDELFNDSIDVRIDTMGYIMRQRGGASSPFDTIWLALPGTTRAVYIERAANPRDNDTIAVGTGRGASFRILAGDKINVLSEGNAGYPFEYVFKKAQRADATLRVKNPVQSRMLVIARDSASPRRWGVYICWNAPDFTRVYETSNMTNGLWDGLILWAPLFYNNTALSSQANLRPRTMTMNEDGTVAFIAVQDIVENKSFIVRLRGFETVDYSQNLSDIRDQISGPLAARQTSRLTLDTFYLADGERYFPRTISSMNVSGSDLVLTFDGYNEDYANVAVISNCNADTWSIAEKAITGKKGLPAFCSLVEKTTGKVYVGTSEGISILNSVSGSSWSTYNKIYGVPVTALTQQKFNLPVRRHIGHTGINRLDYVFAKTKWPNAIYIGTYGRGIFMDMEYVTDTTNECSDSTDWNVNIPTVNGTELSQVSVFPNPVYGEANINLSTSVAGQARLVVYDLNGRCVVSRDLGHIAEGEQTYTVSTEGMSKGMYLVNVIIGGYTAATKMMVR